MRELCHGSTEVASLYFQLRCEASLLYVCFVTGKSGGAYYTCTVHMQMQTMHSMRLKKITNKSVIFFFYKMENLGMGIANGMGMRMDSGTSSCF